MIEFMPSSTKVEGGVITTTATERQKPAASRFRRTAPIRCDAKRAGGPRCGGGLILLATVGKLGGAMVAARMSGATWLDSFALGALMNTRGLIELVALNIGYDLGIFSPRIFTMLVIMALVTTSLTGPLLGLTEYLRGRKVLVANQGYS